VSILQKEHLQQTSRRKIINIQFSSAGVSNVLLVTGQMLNVQGVPK